MKKLIKISLLFIVPALMFSCKKHEIVYNTTPVENMAEFQLHYFVPVTASSSNNIYQVEVNGEIIANKTAPLNTYNAIPSGAVGRFYAVKSGQTNIKLYMGDDLTLVYDQNVDLQVGKQNVFVYDFDKAPIVFDNGYPYERIVTQETGTTSWVKFYNFLFDSTNAEGLNIPTPLKLQYQYQYTLDIDTKAKSDWIDFGNPVSFGETTGWVELPVTKEVEISSGYGRIDYRVMVINPDGSEGELLQVLNASGNMVDYTDWWNAYVGRRNHQVLSGMRLAKPNCAVRQFAAL